MPIWVQIGQPSSEISKTSFLKRYEELCSKEDVSNSPLVTVLHFMRIMESTVKYLPFQVRDQTLQLLAKKFSSYNLFKVSRRSIDSPLQRTTARYSLEEPSTIQYGPRQSSAAQPSPIQPSTTQYRPVEPITAKYSPVQPSTAQFSPVKSNWAHKAQYSPVGLKLIALHLKIINFTRQQHKKAQMITLSSARGTQGCSISKKKLKQGALGISDPVWS